MSIKEMTAEYEEWLRSVTKVDEAELKTKHNKMACSEFMFLRATFYCWAHSFSKHCPALCTALKVLGVGDLHIENFGTWRDAEGRLSWGVNDFDEACYLPYTNDLVRLATSAFFALKDGSKDGSKDTSKDDSNRLRLNFEEACEAILDGYIEGLKDPKPFVLAEDHGWLRNIVIRKLVDDESLEIDGKDKDGKDKDGKDKDGRDKDGKDKDGKDKDGKDKDGKDKDGKDKDGKHKDDVFKKFHEKYRDLARIEAPPDARAALDAGFPKPTPDYHVGHREAGLGSLGRQRFTAVADDWQGGIIVREAKALAPSAWLWANQSLDASSSSALSARSIYYPTILVDAVRSPDPWLKIVDSWVVRRLGPDAFKVEVKHLKLEASKEEELTKKLLHSMGKEIANVHSHSCDQSNDVLTQVKERSSNAASSGWLVDAARTMVERTKEDFLDWKKEGFECPPEEKES